MGKRHIIHTDNGCMTLIKDANAFSGYVVIVGDDENLPPSGGFPASVYEIDLWKEILRLSHENSLLITHNTRLMEKQAS